MQNLNLVEELYGKRILISNSPICGPSMSYEMNVDSIDGDELFSYDNGYLNINSENLNDSYKDEEGYYFFYRDNSSLIITLATELA